MIGIVESILKVFKTSRDNELLVVWNRIFENINKKTHLFLTQNIGENKNCQS